MDFSFTKSNKKKDSLNVSNCNYYKSRNAINSKEINNEIITTEKSYWLCEQ